MSGPLIWATPGGLPATARLFSYGHGRGATATCDSTVFPGEAVFFNLGLQDIYSRFFTARGPPMHNFNRPFRVGGKCTEGKQRGNGNSDGEVD